MKKGISILLFMALFSGCFWRNEQIIEPPKKDGYRPVYLSREDLEKVSVLSPQAMKTPGKIYIKDKFLFVNEQAKGVHIFNNTDPKKPLKLAFVNIPGNMDIAIRGTIMYADNGRDLIVIDVANPSQAKIINRIKDIFPNAEFPEQTGVYFECVDNAKGVVIGWEKNSYNSSLKCFR